MPLPPDMGEEMPPDMDMMGEAAEAGPAMNPARDMMDLIAAQKQQETPLPDNPIPDDPTASQLGVSPGTMPSPALNPTPISPWQDKLNKMGKAADFVNRIIQGAQGGRYY
jgi:hypothetical protein